MPPRPPIFADGRVQFSRVEGRLRVTPVGGSDVLAHQGSTERIRFRFLETDLRRLYDIVQHGDHIYLAGCFHGEHQNGTASGVRIIVGPVDDAETVVRRLRGALSLPPQARRVASAAELSGFEQPTWVEVEDTYRIGHNEASDFGPVKLRLPRNMRSPLHGQRQVRVRVRGLYWPRRRSPGARPCVGYNGSYLYVLELFE